MWPKLKVGKCPPIVKCAVTPRDRSARIIAGQFDDPYQLDEKGLFDLVNLNRDDLGGIPGARRPPGNGIHASVSPTSVTLAASFTR